MIAKLYTRQVSQATHMSFSVHRFRVMQRFVSSHRANDLPTERRKFKNVDDVTCSGKKRKRKTTTTKKENKLDVVVVE